MSAADRRNGAALGLLKAPLRRAGIDRSTIIRRLVRLGHPRLRELRASAMTGTTPSSRVLRPVVRALENGVLRVPQGHAGGLALDLKYLPISHAHLGSIAFGNLESEVQEAMIRHLGQGGVFYDIGANLGFFALLGAHLVGLDSGQVYAFEAAPENAAAITRNAELNALPNVTVIAKAVSDHSGRGRLQVVDDQSWSKLEEYGPHPYTEEVIDVELVALDDLLSAGEIRPPTVVKIDVEGAELAVLEGMRSTIAEHQPAIICELHDTHREFLALVKDLGYRAINLTGAVPVDQAGASAHALALPALDPGD
jgi:FkbM family methyltransferase